MTTIAETWKILRAFLMSPYSSFGVNETIFAAALVDLDDRLSVVERITAPLTSHRSGFPPAESPTQAEITAARDEAESLFAGKS